VPLARAVWNQVFQEPWRHPLRTRLTVLAPDAQLRVVDRLAAAGHLALSRSCPRRVAAAVTRRGSN
jgi:hypothetical protein